MADVSASAAKEHVLKGSKEIQRISGDAVEAVREATHRYMGRIGSIAEESAKREGRKTIMDTDVAAAVRALNLGGVPASPSSEGSSEGESAPQA
jgi:histone H3/H4